MKIFRILAMLTISLLLFTGCEDDEIMNYAFQEISAPTNVTASFDVMQDDSGTVTVTPSGDGATTFEVYFGDTEDETPTIAAAGETLTHVYDEGEYMLRVVAVGSTGLTSEFNQMLTIAFRAPENLEVTVDQPAGDPRNITLSASADFATLFDVYFTDSEDEEPVQLMPGESIPYSYDAPGTYSIRVVARGAGVATTETTVEVVVPEANDPVKFPITYDEPTVNYALGVFNGASFEVITNPDLSGANTAENNVGALTNSGGAFEGGFYNLGEPLDFSGSAKTISVKIWSDVAVPVLLKFEGGVSGERQTEVTANHTGSGWEELTFNFATDAVKSFVDGDPENGTPFVPTGQYGTMVIFIDGPGNTAGTFYLDDFKQTGAAFASDIVQDFEGTAPAFTVFGGIAATEVVDNPDPSGANTTSKVAKLTKSSGSEVWAGTFFETAAPLDLNTYNTVRVRTWSPKAGATVRFKLENQADNSLFYEVDAVTTVENQWEILEFDLSGADSSVDFGRVVLFFDFGNNGDDSVYYFDEIQLTNGGVEMASDMVIEDLEGDAPAYTVFGGIPGIEIIDNPDQSGVNTSATVAKLTKTDGSEVWAGTFYEEEMPLDLDTYSKMKIKTWSPKAGATVRLKFENLADNSLFYEVDAVTTVENEWEILEFDLSGADTSIEYGRVVLFFDFGNNGDGSEYYFDEYTLSN
ncbi:hypothetical protein [Gramella sp. MAR_2010_147]|uniref:hypothetical protein n=1 Tax=Gramella sp. MAR_2010_147 TaxID=1250205 RepID=UPI00087B51C0|nr:hypothetical protein [Gramella sp. MAR_2010_147]SDS30385.1 hypothetical protein SAMN04488553_1949 [Gramella sp. MAR_2010_147]